MVHTNFVDGSGWNGVNSAYCIILNYGENLEKKYIKVFEEEIKVPKIEYMGIIAGLELAKENSILYSDAKNIVDEVNLKRTLQNLELFKQIRELMKEKNIKVSFISRTKNVAGIELEKRLKKLHQYQSKVMYPKVNPQLKKDRRRRRYVK